jgi:hypothetical protein
MGKMVDSAIATGVSGAVARSAAVPTSVMGYGTTSAGAGAATIDIEVSNDGVAWVVAGTLDLTLATTIATTTNTDGFNINAGWSMIRANVTAISGTDAEVTVTIS